METVWEREGVEEDNGVRERLAPISVHKVVPQNIPEKAWHCDVEKGGLKKKRREKGSKFTVTGQRGQCHQGGSVTV